MNVMALFLFLLNFHICLTYFRIHGIAVSDGVPYFFNHINKALSIVGLESTKAEDIIHVIEGHKGKGYGISTQDELGRSI